MELTSNRIPQYFVKGLVKWNSTLIKDLIKKSPLTSKQSFYKVPKNLLIKDSMRIFTLVLWIFSQIAFAGNTNIPCPVPYAHMKPEMFAITNHRAEAYLKNKQSGFSWHVLITTDKLILDRNSVDSFLRANKSQIFAFEGPGGLGQSRYSCSYINPFPYNASFVSGSDGY